MVCAALNACMPNQAFLPHLTMLDLFNVQVCLHCLRQALVKRCSISHSHDMPNQDLIYTAQFFLLLRSDMMPPRPLIDTLFCA